MLRNNILLVAGIGLLIWFLPAVLAAQTQWSDSQMDCGYVVFGYNTLQNLPANYVPKPAETASKLSCVMARGEYESVQFGVHALDGGLANIKATVTCDIPVTIYHRIDPAVKQKLAEDKSERMPGWMSSEIYLQRGERVLNLQKGESVNFWLTFSAPDNAAPGTHQGKLRVEVEGRPATELDLEVKVRPFKLADPRARFSMYYEENRIPGARHSVWMVSESLQTAMFGDMAAHGQNSLELYMVPDFSKMPPEERAGAVPMATRIDLAKKAGLVSQDIPCTMLQHNLYLQSKESPSGLSEKQLTAATTWLQAQHRDKGWPELIAYGQDEPQYPTAGLRETYGPLRSYPIRVGTAISATGVYAYGDVHDVWIVMGGEITPEMQAEAKRLGAEVCTYSYRILREGYMPLRQRFFTGLYTWAHKLAGNYVWAYVDGPHSYVWFMPGSEEPMPLTGYEGRREGVDDYRYLQMLEQSIAAKKSDPTAKKAVVWLSALREKTISLDPHLADVGTPLGLDEYDSLRATAASYIEKLGVVPPGKTGPVPISYVRDEAKAFRGKSVAQCRAGLRSKNAPTRRAAASALFEMGSKAAPAVPELGKAVGDPAVRIPALKALEAIGPDAFPAVVQIKPLQANKDSFIRLAATFALVGIARPGSWSEELSGYDPGDVSPHARELAEPLGKALADGYPQISDAASFGLFYCGEASADSLPVAIATLENKTNDGAAAKLLAGLGPKAAAAVPGLIKRVEAVKGQDIVFIQALAAIGPAASDAVPVLEKYRTPDNPYSPGISYALFCIRGDQKDLEAIVESLGQTGLPYGTSEWYAAARFLGALGGRAAPVADAIRDKLPMLDAEPTVKRQVESVCLKRITDNAKPLRLLPR